MTQVAQQGAYIPQQVLDREVLIPGLTLRHRGKVRNSYDIPGHPDKMLVVVTDRASIFDFVLGGTLPLKGEYLNAFNHFWTKKFQEADLPVDQIAAGNDIDTYLPERNRCPYLRRRATVVQILPSPQAEDVVRFYLTGSAWKSYEKTRTVCGHQLPFGLKNGSRLPKPLYTPTTKAAQGHDEPMSVQAVRQMYPGREEMALQAAQIISDTTAAAGIITADLKLELSLYNGTWYVVDERGTPDACRFWDQQAYEAARKIGELPSSFDKQVLRNWGIANYVDADDGQRERDPNDSEDREYVASLAIPSAVTEKTMAGYEVMFYRLTSMNLTECQQTVMGCNKS